MANVRSSAGALAASLAVSIASAAPLPLLAQALDPATLREVDDDRTDLTHQNLTVAQIEDMNVVREGSIVGEIEDVLVDEQNRIVAVVVDKASRDPGGIESDVVMPIDRLTFDPESRQAITTMTADEMEALPSWPDD
ncbi:MAG TPA: PRC-barrel domain-containing protein [Gammaproteobacteria bacterium]